VVTDPRENPVGHDVAARAVDNGAFLGGVGPAREDNPGASTSLTVSDP
jgi:hypothetical protein